jgi:GDPmannose 4,6-dehydratase
MKTAFITGIGGQDGYFLSRLLLSKGYSVYGLVRFSDKKSMGNLLALPKGELKRIKLLEGDITDVRKMSGYVKKYKFNEIYHLAGQSSIHPSLKDPSLAYRDNIESVLTLLEAIKDFSPKTKLFIASSSELFGNTTVCPQNEETPFFPRNPYGFSKLGAFWAAKYYRENHKIFVCSGILYNHESEMRGEQFVTRKISMGVARIHAGVQKEIVLGDISAKRDWGYAGDYVKAMWAMLQQKKADDYIIATGKPHSVKDFVEEAFRSVGITLTWSKKGNSLVAKDSKKNRILVRSTFAPPANTERVLLLVGDASKAKKILKWSPRIGFRNIVRVMVYKDITNKAYHGKK